MKINLKSTLSKLLEKLIHLLNQWHTKLITKTGDLKFDDLTPISDPKQNASYIDALNWAVNNPNARNIALTGPYGSGKSSILKSFIELTNKKHITISLATFNDGLQKLKTDSSPDLNNNTSVIVSSNQKLSKENIEANILLQIFYQIDPRRTKYSRFKRINSLSLPKLLGVASLVSIWLLALAGTINNDLLGTLHSLKISKYFKTVFHEKEHLYLKVIMIIITLIGLVLLISKILQKLLNAKISKLNVKDGEIDLTDQNSILNKHLEEIIYVFQSAKLEVVLIEDLDRFNDTEIFTHLRELNFILNKSKDVTKKITFIYAIKDELFKEKERTKFFDFIIPVIPVINPANSGDKLLQYLKIKEIQDIPIHFVEDISLFIEDMRQLKNIVNEYLVYKKRLEKFRLRDEKIFAVVLCKNFYPLEFSKLNYNTGEMYKILNDRTEYTIRANESIEQQISNINKKIEVLQNIQSKSIEEIKAFYIYKLLSNNTNTIYLQINRSPQITVGELYSENGFNKLLFANTIEFISQNGQAITFRKNISEFEKEIFDGMSLSDLTYQLSEGKERQITQLKGQITRLKKDSYDLNKYSLQQLIIKNGKDIFGKEILNKYKILVWMLEKGYIDESYNDYISYFFPESITESDKQFLLSIKYKEALPFNYNLVKIKNIVKRLFNSEFENREILNITLLDELLNTLPKESERLNSIFKTIIELKENFFDFVDIYFNNGNKKIEFINYLCDKDEDFCKKVLNNNSFSDEIKEIYLRDIVYYADEKDIIKQNRDGQISSCLNNCKYFFTLFSNPDHFKKLQRILPLLSIKLKYLTENVEYNLLQKYIYENNFYELNIENIEFLLISKNANISKNYISRASLTSIYNSDLTKLTIYLNENLQKYINDVFIHIPSNQEDTGIVINLLNSSVLNLKEKREVIRLQEKRIENILQLYKDTWGICFEENKVEASWKNIMIAYVGHIDEKTIIPFLNKKENIRALSMNLLSELDVNNIFESLLDQDTFEANMARVIIEDVEYLEHYDLIKFIFESDKTSLECIKGILPAFKTMKTEIFISESMSREKLELIVDEDLLIFNKEIYQRFKDLFFGLHLRYLELNSYSLSIDNYKDFPLATSDLSFILDSNNFSPLQKSEIVVENNAIPSKDPLIANIICTMILDGSISINDNTTIYQVFRNLNSIDKKVSMFLKVGYGSPEDIYILLKNIGSPYDEIKHGGKRIYLPDEKYNQQLVEHLKQVGYISSYSIDNKGIKINFHRKPNVS